MKSLANREISYSAAESTEIPQRPSMLSEQQDTADIVAAFWRYRWAVILPTVVGACVGFMIFVRTPEVFRSTTRLLVESDQAAILDSITGDVIGGVMGVDLVKSQLFSDRVGAMAFKSPGIERFHGRFGGDPQVFVGAARNSLKLDAEVTDSRTAQVFLLHFEHGDPELCEAAVKAYSDALEEYFNDRHRNSRSDLLNLIEVAIQQLQPSIAETEKLYREFRRKAPLAWDSEGNAINPHRERQLFLVERRSELDEQKRQKQIQTAQLEEIVKQSKSPLLALDVVSQLLDVAIVLPSAGAAAGSLVEGDMELAEIEVNQKLIPLLIERKQVRGPVR